MNIECLIVEETYFDKCDILRNQKVKDEKTKISKMENVILYSNVKCAVSRGSRTVNSSNEVATEINSYKLYANPSILIKTGDNISVTFENGLQANFIASKPMFYKSHLEAILTEVERIK